MHVLITGGAGFIGSATAEVLAQAGHAVLLLDDLSTGSTENIGASAVAFEHVDVRNGGGLTAAFGRFRPEAVLHLAAVASVPRSISDPVTAQAVNLGGTAAVLEAARLSGARRFVFASSAAVYGPTPSLPSSEKDAVDPASPYAAHKAAGELLARAYRATWGMETVSLRYFNVYGERQRADDPYSGVIARFADALAAGRPATITGDGSQSRDFIHVADVARANASALTGADPGSAPINIGSGEALTVRRLYTLLASLLDAPDEPLFAPSRPGDLPHSRAAVQRLRDKLHVEPQISIEEGLGRLIAWRQRLP
jgi:UDP-glucose 4-epimerase